MYKIIARNGYEEVPFTFDNKRDAMNLVSDYVDHIEGKFIVFKEPDTVNKENPD